ncbi:hypothetical protein KIH74_00780 [Kineosporia sp. J2-2]|uniref:O-antigen ligase like membrane protein n=1 Tax=Kineosporia corallincola TaxID=2835133 RepID=A0ABS5T8N0_9ACTN|nr:hypothetical protein [Kineosporia corallincola]MBT0767435.1 hypothetical protein [Kineosporia corallincola]
MSQPPGSGMPPQSGGMSYPPRRSPETGSGLIRKVRQRWRRPKTSPQPTLDALAAFDERSERLRLVDAMPVKKLSEADRRYMLRLIKITVLVCVVGQRIALPLGGFPISLPLVATYAFVVLARLRGGVRYNRVRSELFIASAALILLATYLAGFTDNTSISVNSVLLLLIIYIPWIFCISTQFRELFVPVARFYTQIMLVAATIGVFQLGSQYAGVWVYEDYLLKWLPENFLVQDYNVSYQLAWNDPTTKANAFVFLEPSFLCQYLALALVIALLIRAPAWQPALLGLGMASTLSGTGIILLVISIGLMVIVAPNRIRPAYVLAGAVGLAIVFATPAATILLDRRDETSQQGSSGYIRFVQPYTEVADGLGKEVTRLFVGAGPGSADRLLTSFRSGGDAVVYTIAPKLAFEYGLVAMVVFVAFLMVSVYRGPPIPVLPTAMLIMIFFLSGSLLQPHTVALAWLLTSVWGPPVTVGVSDALAAVMRRDRDQAAV